MSLPNFIKNTKVRKASNYEPIMAFQGRVSVSSNKRPLVVLTFDSRLCHSAW